MSSRRQTANLLWILPKISSLSVNILKERLSTGAFLEIKMPFSYLTKMMKRGVNVRDARAAQKTRRRRVVTILCRLHQAVELGSLLVTSILITWCMHDRNSGSFKPHILSHTTNGVTSWRNQSIASGFYDAQSVKVSDRFSSRTTSLSAHSER